jgi:NAD(P)H dehydrogenase (quinone)
VEKFEEAYASRASYGAPEWEVEGWVTTYEAIAAGEMDVVSGAIDELAAHAPMAFPEFLRRYPESYWPRA